MRKPLALIVEDQDDISAMFATALRDVGFETEIVRDGDAALTWLFSSVPDLVVLDLHLPGVGGDEVLKRIRADARLAGVQVIVATAYPRTIGDVHEDADWVFLKPFDLSDLRDLATYLTSVKSLGRRASKEADWDGAKA